MRKYVNYINGEFDSSGIQDYLKVENPATEEFLAETPLSSVSKIDEAVACAKEAQKGWQKLTEIERAVWLRKISARLRERTEHFAKIIASEQGKIMSLARVEVNFATDYIDFMAEWARRIEGEIIGSDRKGENIFLFRRPIGVVGGILPWNFPFFLIMRKMAPALICGNTIVIKPSIETPNNAFEFAELLKEINFPKGVVNIVGGRGSTVGEHLAGHKDVGLVSFTGSVETGVKIMEVAAKNVTRVNLELGGKAPAIVMDDADLDLAVNAIVASRIINSGQVCNCAERVYVQKKVAKEFTQKLVAKMAAAKYGNPTDPGVDYGPMVNKVGMESVAMAVEKAVKDGAQVLTGGSVDKVNGKGYYYKPTVLAGCQQSWDIVRKETFGPVLPLVEFSTLDEAIMYANDCDYGLTSSIYTRNLDNALRAANEIDFGETYINRENMEAMQGFHAGHRKSGIGGADGKHGLYEFLSTHIVYIQGQNG